MKIVFKILIFALCSVAPIVYIQANVFKKIGRALKRAANKTVSGLKSAARAVTRDSKATRSVDYGVRRGALEVALRTAQLSFDGADKILQGARGVTQADPRLIALNTELAALLAQKGTLIASRETANGILEAAKQTGTFAVGTVAKGAVKGILDTFSITGADFKGSLEEILGGVIPKLRVTFKIVGKDLSLTVGGISLSTIHDGIEKIGDAVASEVRNVLGV